MKLLVLPALLGGALLLAACDATGDDGALVGTWSGEHTFVVDTVIAEANIHVTADYVARYTFAIDQNGQLVRSSIEKVNTGTFRIQEPRPDGYPERNDVWEEDFRYRFDGVGTFVDPVMELDFPVAEELEVFPSDLWTFDVTGDRASLNGVRILNGYAYPAWIVQDPETEGLEFFEFVIEPREMEFSMTRISDDPYVPVSGRVAEDDGGEMRAFDRLQRSEQ